MPTWEINDGMDILGLTVIIAMMIGGLVLVLMKRKATLKVGGNVLETSGDSPPVNKQTGEIVERRKNAPQILAHDCILEHTDTLAKLEKDMCTLQEERESLGQDIRSLYMMVQPMIPAMKIMLLALKGEKINGNLEHAVAGLDKAEGYYTDATIGRMG